MPAGATVTPSGGFASASISRVMALRSASDSSPPMANVIDAMVRSSLTTDATRAGGSVSSAVCAASAVGVSPVSDEVSDAMLFDRFSSPCCSI